MGKFLQVKYNADSAFAALDALAGASEEVLPRVVAQSGAQYMVGEVRRKVLSLGRGKGLLHSSIYQAFSPENSGKGRSQYNVSWRTKRNTGLPYAPHGHWMEHGFTRRYQARQRADGTWFTLRRAGNRDKKAPSRWAPQAVRDAFWVPRSGGPVSVLGKRFIRGTYDTHKERVIAHMLGRAQYEMIASFGA